MAWIFRDYAVLQQGMSIPVWGKAEPEVPVHVEINDKTVDTVPSRTSEFMVRFPAENAGGPYTLTVTRGGVKSRFRT